MDGLVVLVGAGGVAAPAALALAAAGVRALRLVDDDAVELANLHRQILFEDGHLGQAKTGVLAEVLGQRYPRTRVELCERRALPHTAAEVLAGARVVVDGTDNFASRFLLADAAHLAAVPIVHAAAVRWQATVLTVSAAGRPCYRCLFEDIPAGPQLDCATAGIMGPVCGVSGAVAADRALRLLGGEHSVCGTIVTYAGRQDRLREVVVHARSSCPLCGARATIDAIEPARYLGPACGEG